MAKMYHFYAQKESMECPVIPCPVSVWGESGKDATEKLAKALKNDPLLEKKHSEFEKPAQKEHNEKRKK